MKVLVTGAGGFTGRYLTKVLTMAGFAVVGLSNNELDIEGIGQTLICDLCDSLGLAEVVETVRPNIIVHLAAIAYVGHNNVDELYRTNVVGTRNLLEALTNAKLKLNAVLLASSANVYGNGSEGTIDESAVVAPTNDYAVSKLAMEYVARLYADSLPLIIARPFNYTGIGQSDNFLLPKIVLHVRRRVPIIQLGNLNVARDFSDVRNVVEYYLRILR